MSTEQHDSPELAEDDHPSQNMVFTKADDAPGGYALSEPPQRQFLDAVAVPAFHVADVDLDKPDLINHPPHYTSNPAGIECIDVVEHLSFNVGNAIKYLWRCDLKQDPIADLQKAKWYIEREIKRRKK